MRNDMFYGVQFAQARYELQQNAGGNVETVGVVENSEAFETSGAGQVNEEKFDLIITNSASQYIEEGIDENHAIGHWTTISYEYAGTEIGDDIYLVIGKYCNEFVVENHIWKLEKVNWEESYRCGPWKVGEDNNFENYLKNPSGWAIEMPELVSLENMETSAKTMEILKLRNEIMGDIIYKLDTLKDAKTLLVTSPVVKMSNSLDEAEVFISVNRIDECDESKVQSTRGSIFLKLEVDEKIEVDEAVDGKWSVKEQNWYNYATLEPWQIA